ncbi:MAG: hypothetical protein IT169_04735 [Bryobacterales bacterium]|nr:hypothetical protein [Bryobacterales bacterium]
MPAALIWLTLALSAIGQEAPSLFVSPPTGKTNAARVDALPGDPVETLRSRPVSFSPEVWRSVPGRSSGKNEAGAREISSGGTLTLNLFADTNLAFHVESLIPTSDGIGETARGRIGNADGTAIFTYYEGALSGSVRLTNGEFYEVFVPGSGAGEIRQVRFHGFGAPGTDAVAPEEGDLPGEGMLKLPRNAPKAFAIEDLAPIRAAGDAPVVDILVAYTERARQARGDSAGMLAHINQVIAETNAAFDASAVSMQFRLVHAVEVSWDDAVSSMSYSSTLNALRNATDGFLDQVHAFRDQYAADVVSLWVSPPTGSGSFTVGMAYVLANNPPGAGGFAFSVVHQGYAGGPSATFAHETGHNLGLNHDPDNGGANGGLVKDAVGYQQKLLDPKFFTIMAYSNGCGGCQPIVQFSNPQVSFQGIPTGVANQNDAAKTLNVVAPSAASWRGATVVTPPVCSYSVSPSNIGSPAAGGAYMVTVSTTAGCAWTPVSGVGWIVVEGGAARAGSGTFSVSISANAAANPRNGSFSVAGASVGVSQEAAQAQAAVRLQVSAKGLSFQGGIGSSPPAQTLRVRSGQSLTNLTASAPGVSWLSASASPANGGWQISARADAQGLAEGIYDAELQFNCGGAACEPASIPVRYTVRSAGAAGPRIASGGVVNAASFQPGIASGSWVSIFGASLASTTRTWRTADFQGNSMPLSLDGVQVLVDGKAAAVQFIGPGQVNFQAPSGLAPGWARVELRTPGGADFAYVYVSAEFPGFFAFDAEGHVAALHPDGMPVGDVNGGASYQARPAAVGEAIAIYGTGFGLTAPDVPAGQVFTGVANLLSLPNLSVSIGGQSAAVRFAGLTGAGLNQINVVVPDVPPGTYEIVADVAGSPTQFSGKLTVR